MIKWTKKRKKKKQKQKKNIWKLWKITRNWWWPTQRFTRSIKKKQQKRIWIFHFSPTVLFIVFSCKNICLKWSSMHRSEMKKKKSKKTETTATHTDTYAKQKSDPCLKVLFDFFHSEWISCSWFYEDWRMKQLFSHLMVNKHAITTAKCKEQQQKELIIKRRKRKMKWNEMKKSIWSVQAFNHSYFIGGINLFSKCFNVFSFSFSRESTKSVNFLCFG